MTVPRLPDVLNVAAASLTAIGDAPMWLALSFVLPSVLAAVTRTFSEALAGISRFRTETMRRRHEDRLLGEVIDAAAGLGHLERVGHEPPPSAAPPTVDPAPSHPPLDNPPSGSPP
ncbi:hypothetical protein ACIBL8_21790 [Streptomyces sp. NPDC050523]|uniref:hypothetical protein n=1 Tax=Streptomyces sp. NPDC050523 TaxID=3365622 RepID=UPI00378C7F64